MKKTLITLLVVSLFSFGLFAANPGPSTFDVTTTVLGINLMKITKAEFTGTTEDAFDDAAEFGGEVEVSASGTQTFDAWISTLSNSRAGYKVTMTATAMKSSQTDLPDSFIYYTVTANGESVDTSVTPAESAVVINKTTGLTVVAPESHKISLSVDENTFAAAVEGEYKGTVTFTWTTP